MTAEDRKDRSEDIAVPGDPNEEETVRQVARRIGVPDHLVHVWHKQGLFPQEPWPDKRRLRNKLLFPKGIWPGVAPTSNRVHREFLKRHPETKDLITTKEYAEMWQLNPTYVWMVCAGKYPEISFPGARRVGRMWMVPKGERHVVRERGEAFRQGRKKKRQDLKDAGLVTVKEAEAESGISRRVLRQMCESGVFENVAYRYKTYWMPKDAPVLTDPAYFAETDDPRALRSTIVGNHLHKEVSGAMRKMLEQGKNYVEVARDFMVTHTTVKRRTWKE